jgi:hypothetical protein
VVHVPTIDAIRATACIIGALTVLASCVLASCSSDDEFRQTGFPPGIGVDTETDFRGAMEHHHMAPNDIDCMVRQAFGETPSSAAPTTAPSGPVSRPRSGPPAHMFYAEELHAFAADCGIDVSKLWSMSD